MSCRDAKQFEGGVKQIEKGKRKKTTNNFKLYRKKIYV